jgi:hypothetical protein
MAGTLNASKDEAGSTRCSCLLDSSTYIHPFEMVLVLDFSSATVNWNMRRGNAKSLQAVHDLGWRPWSALRLTKEKRCQLVVEAKASERDVDHHAPLASVSNLVLYVYLSTTHLCGTSCVLGLPDWQRPSPVS